MTEPLNENVTRGSKPTREAIDASLMAMLRARYLGRPITIEWVERDLLRVKPLPRETNPLPPVDDLI